ncbi:hypothetical protein E1258_09525 [Micromonospora sp. KC207]|uniref:hypothetical protein n=1 Tax=Micromonospora sp. KC207 TaxID=2530377 RepID=UPI001043485D|nr:hypothetical protein [Micromonospora sp. KC207]TDC63876.1 hypothetical protein E1258_09525 [Micromonospora sp. KC207]
MTGYQVPRRVLDLELPSYPGLTVQARSISMGQVLELSPSIEARIFGPAIAPENLPHLEKVLAAFSAALIGWNLTEDGQPVPADATGLRSLDPDLFRALVLAWIDAMVQVPRPLAPPSAGGEPSPELSIPMEVS